MHERGFGGASVRDIAQAAGVPQGSFTSHFASKEAFGLEVLDLYSASNCALVQETLRNDALAPLARLRAYIARNKAHLCAAKMRNGCMLGNFSAEAVDQSEAIRLRLVEIFAALRESIAYCLRAAVDAGEVAAIDCDDLASFVMASMQGATLLAKAERSVAPIERFERVLFDLVLR